MGNNCIVPTISLSFLIIYMRTMRIIGLGGDGKDVLCGDVLFFYFSGHGGQAPDMSGQETNGYNKAIVPVGFQIKRHIVEVIAIELIDSQFDIGNQDID